MLYISSVSKYKNNFNVIIYLYSIYRGDHKIYYILLVIFVPTYIYILEA